MDRTNQKITWTLLELSGLLEEEDAHVHFERTTKHLALHPYHLINIQRGLNQILKSSLNNYDKELNGFVLAFKNPKVLSNFGEVLYDSPFIHIDIEADFYLFRPKIGSFVKGIVNKKGLDHIVVLVHKIYTISIPKPDNEEEWIGDSVEVGQEIRCCINQVDNKCKPPFIRATLNSDYLQGCKLSDSIIIHNMENITDMINDTESHNLNSIKIEKTNDEISENDISEKEEKKHRKKHKKSRDIDTYKNIKYEDDNTDSTIEGLNENSTVIIENSINEDDTVSDKGKKKHRKKHKNSHEIVSESFLTYQTKAESSNNTDNDTYKYIKYEINSNTDIIENQNLNSTVKIDTSINQTLENDIISEKEKRKYKKKHKKSHASDLESTSEDKNETTLNSNIHINIKCEDNIHNTNGAESHNLEYLNNNAIKIDSWNGISDDAFSDKEKQKFRKKHKKSREIDPESISENKNEIKLNYNNTDSSSHKNIKCEDNIHNTNSAIENHNLDRIIKIENLTNGISEDTTFDREKTKHRKKRKKSRETDTENETASDYLESCKKRKKTSTSPDSELKTSIKIKTEKFDSNLELKSPIKIKVEKSELTIY